jgi:hypothetical protein
VGPLAVLVDRDALGERLALADPDFGQAVDDQVIDLRSQTIDLVVAQFSDRPK